MGMSEKTKTGWDQLCKHSKLLNETKDCSVKAIAAVTGVHYVDVHSLLAHYGREPRQGCYITTQHAVLKALGFTKEPLKVRSKTVRTLGREFRYRPGKYLVYTRGHVLAIVDGDVMDWTNGRLHRITEVYRIRPKHE